MNEYTTPSGPSGRPQAEGEGANAPSPGCAKKPKLYEEHYSADVHGFQVADVTCRIENHEHDHLIWLGHYMEGAWLSVVQIQELKDKIQAAIDVHLARHSLSQVVA